MNTSKFVTVRISPTIANEYATRCPEEIPDEVYLSGRRSITVACAHAMLADAEFNSDTKAFDVGEYGVPLGVFNAYRALAKQLRSILVDPRVRKT